MLPNLTVWETLMFVAHFTLNESEEVKVQQVDAVIKRLGLSHITETRVGNEHLRGISGGERRRVSIGMQLVNTPSKYTYSRVAYIYVRSRAKYLKFRTTTSKFNTLRKPLMQQKYYFIHEM